MDIPANPPGTAPRVTGRGGAATAASPRPGRPLRRGAAGDRRAIRRNRRAGRQPHPVPPAADEPLAGHHPQRHGRPHRGRPAVRAAHLRRPSADRPGPAAVRRRPAEFRRAVGGGTGHDLRRARRLRPQPGGHAGGGEHHAVRPVGRGRAGAGAEIGGRAAAYRVRAAGIGPRTGDPGQRRGPGGEPGDRDAAGHAAVGPAAGQQLPERAAVRPPIGGGAPPGGRGTGGRPVGAGRADLAGRGAPAWRPGPPAARAAPA